MPCPSEMQLRLMGQVLRDAKLCNVSDQNIHERIRDYGPFIQLVLMDNDVMLEDYKIRRENEISTLGGDNLGRLLTNITDVSENGVNHLSHRIVRFRVNRHNSKSTLYGYRQMLFISACDAVVCEIKKMINLFDKQTIIDHLVKINNSTVSLEQFIPKYLERIAVMHSTALDGLKWKSRSLINAQSEWEPMMLKFVKLEAGHVQYSEMKDRSLYYPLDHFFPLVDMYWRDNDILCAIQATTRSGMHPKPISTFKKFFKELNVEMNSIKFILYYLIMPNQKGVYSKKILYPCSTFYDDNVIAKPMDFGAKFEFFAICPPEDFSSETK
jgi:hypothetical protein